MAAHSAPALVVAAPANGANMSQRLAGPGIASSSTIAPTLHHEYLAAQYGWVSYEIITS